MPQHLYLRFLLAKSAVCSRVTEFAAYFWQAIPEVRGKYEIYRPDTSFRNPRPAVLLSKIRLCLEVFDFSRHFRKSVKTERPEAVDRQTPLGKQPPLNAKTAFRRFPRTKPDVPSQGLITSVTLRKNSGSVNPISPI